MKEVAVLLEKANKFLEVADHLAYVTYPMVKEPKLGFTITEHLYNACNNAIDALLFYEYAYKRIENCQNEGFAKKMDIFKRTIAPRYNIDRKQLFIIEDMHSLLSYRKKSQIEFVKKDKVIICNPDFDIRTITMEKIKSYVYESKNFLIKINSMLKPTLR